MEAFFILRDRGFRECGEKLSSADQTDFFSNKTAGHKSVKEQCARRFGVFSRTSEIRVHERRRQGHLRNIYPVKTGGSRYDCHPFVSYQPKAGMLLLNAASQTLGDRRHGVLASQITGRRRAACR